MADEDVVQRLDLILATLRLAFAPQLREVRDEMRGNPVTAAILDATENWTASTGIQSTVAKKTGAHAPTVRDCRSSPTRAYLRAAGPSAK